MRALAVTTPNLEAAGLMTNDVAAEYNMLADRAASRPLTKDTRHINCSDLELIVDGLYSSIQDGTGRR
jgi:hypothetical protein